MAIHSILSHSVDKVGQQWDGFGTTIGPHCAASLRDWTVRAEVHIAARQDVLDAFIRCIVGRALKRSDVLYRAGSDSLRVAGGGIVIPSGVEELAERHNVGFVA